ncbi:MAG: ATP-binding protein [Desulfuromonadaceae bacterium]|nr:ATP-binding protein [Desulfuromonas sp.]MDY0184955.1 ATP-binding protein [Desulfuromonadaceae bacterium]
MRSLFFKIFFYFWGLIVLVIVVIVGLTLFREQQFPPAMHRHLAQRAAIEYGSEAVNRYELKGVDALKTYTHTLRREQGLALILFDADATPLIESKIACGMQNLVIRTLQTGEVESPMGGRRNALAAVVQSDSGKNYVAAAWLPNRPVPQHIVAELTRGLFGWQLLFVLSMTALGCFILTRSFTTPISRLRLATHRFASGDLSTRIGSEIKGGNEIALLASDFDEMATRIEALVGGQQRLLRDISHELRSPLTRLGIALELVRNEGCTPKQEKSLQRIELESERMNTMIGELLDLTRMEHAETTLIRTEVDLGHLLADIVQDATYEATKRDVRVVLEVEGEAKLAVVPELMARAFENVIRNAVRYTASATQVDIKVCSDAEQIHLLIQDRGAGVPETEVEKLFIPFYRVAQARERNNGGTGIGLAIARRAVELHKGTITASNRSGGGLQVSIILPRERKD